GGHIYPLLAFADCLRRHQPDLRITCVGSSKGLEGQLIPAVGYELRQVPAYQLPRSVNLDLARTPTRMLRSMKAGRQVLDDVAADVVVGFGGYVAVPAYLAAWRRRTPIVIHELNVPPGVANRLGMRFTKHVAVGFPYQPTVSPMLRDARVVGVPLRPAISSLNRAVDRYGAREHFGLDPRRPTLFVFGASQGARSINLAIAGAAKAVTAAGVQVLHVIGARNAGIEIPPDLPAPYVTVPYISDMELGYAAADLVLSRGGAMTLAEVTTVGLPAIYVPLPYGNGEQRRNALPVVQAGGGVLVDDADLTPEWIERNVIPLALDTVRLSEMSEVAARFGRRDGDEALRAFVLDVVAGRV
ncbi:MAG TPA: UDP-N-acetylglucosamine--N-acetylmuramyl-(pentapeptide) pyrophosphoryl-undecaprenol N-acetylglucosamine transferase, partial [Micromonosporaceae bacterium]